MSLNREVLPFRLAVSFIVVLIYGAVITRVAQHYSIPLNSALQPLTSPRSLDGFYLGKFGGAIVPLLLLWCFGLFDRRA